MAWRIAFVAANKSRLRTTLLAQFTAAEAGPRVAGSFALVPLAGQLLIARHATREAVLAARNRFALFVATVTPLSRLHHTRRTRGRRVAVV